MFLPKLKIGKLVVDIPIIQGGMAVKISMANLASAVANCGGIGVIAGTGISVDELTSEIRDAKKRTKGLIGVNVMVAAKEFTQLVKAAAREKIDLIFAGAGISRDVFDIGKKFDIPIVPIVSTVKLAKLVEKLGASAVVVEGTEAGGHLGTTTSVKEIVPQVKKHVNIPVIAAGGIVNGKDVVSAFEYGADGVQMGTRFALSKESNASHEFKQAYMNAQQEDVILIDSPVGLPGRAIKNVFTEKVMKKDNMTPESCENCLKHCTREFCILKALRNSQLGNVDEGLIFSGQNVCKINEEFTVKHIFDNLKFEMNNYFENKELDFGGEK